MVDDGAIDWSVCTWEGARREYVRAYRRLTLRRRLQVLEEMCDLGRHFHECRLREGLPVIPFHRDDPATAAFLRGRREPAAPPLVARRVRAVGEVTPGQVATATVPRRPVDDPVLRDIVRRVVEVAQPDRIILFGSAARGQMGPDSDVDLLVVKSGVEHRGELAGRIHLALYGVRAAVDVVVLTPDDVAAHRNKIGSFVGPALAEGKEIYAAAARP